MNAGGARFLAGRRLAERHSWVERIYARLRSGFFHSQTIAYVVKLATSGP